MRAVVTRVTEASVTIDGAEYSRISQGFLVLLGVHVSDTAAEADRMLDRNITRFRYLIDILAWILLDIFLYFLKLLFQLFFTCRAQLFARNIIK